ILTHACMSLLSLSLSLSRYNTPNPSHTYIQGKSYSMVGYGANKGIIPLVCDEMFKATDRAKSEGGSKRYQITCTMLEIYNEAIRDLLNPAINPLGGLKVRSQPGIGVYVEKLTPVAVANYAE